MRFDGETYEPTTDKARLTRQVERVYALMKDGEWRTLAEIADLVDASEAGVSARLRDFRKLRFGGYLVERRRNGRPERGRFEYRLDITTRQLPLFAEDASPQLRLWKEPGPAVSDTNRPAP